MIEIAEDLRDQYYLIKMIPRPKTVKKVETPEKQNTDEKVDLDEDSNSQKE